MEEVYKTNSDNRRSTNDYNQEKETGAPAPSSDTMREADSMHNRERGDFVGRGRGGSRGGYRDQEDRGYKDRDYGRENRGEYSGYGRGGRDRDRVPYDRDSKV